MKSGMRILSSCMAAALVLLLAGCGSIQFQAGANFDPGKLESVLRLGGSTQREVAQALGEPYGRGVALLPFHEAPRVTWTYFYEKGTADLSTGAMADERKYLFVFFDGDKFDSYMWFPSALATVKK